MNDILTSLTLRAERNLNSLRANSYPGRGLIIGPDDTGNYLEEIYWMSGRSEESRNRIFCADGERGHLFTAPADLKKMAGKDTTNIIYSAMRDDGVNFVVSNGHQTDAVMNGINCENPLSKILRNWQYEADPPNDTPRITGVCSLKMNPRFELSILRKSIADSSCERFFFEYDNIPDGFGYCITTYAGDGNPLPAFEGEPILMSLSGNQGTILDRFWGALNEDNRVAIAVKQIEIATGKARFHIRNKYPKLG
ncbi:MAG: IMP cyclohydrolase [Candidatus Taylorbacteria bacterium]